jgi:hypothetical protein
MSDKLGRKGNKLYLVFLLLFSCAKSEAEKPGVYHTELICEDRDIILIRYSRLEDVRHSIARSYAKKKSLDGSEGYTVISLPGNRSMKIDKLSPEDAIKCNLREIFHPRSDRLKKKYMEDPSYNPIW